MWTAYSSCVFNGIDNLVEIVRFLPSARATYRHSVKKTFLRLFAQGTSKRIFPLKFLLRFCLLSLKHLYTIIIVLKHLMGESRTLILTMQCAAGRGFNPGPHSHSLEFGIAEGQSQNPGIDPGNRLYSNSLINARIVGELNWQIHLKLVF